MIIDFTISNFRSIKERKTLSLLAHNQKSDKSHSDSKIDFNIRGFRDSLLKGAAIYGGNASGKSNLLRGVFSFINFALNSFQEIKPNAQIPIEPFSLDNGSKNEPSGFETNFIIDNVRYTYRLEVNRVQVTYESLESYPKGIARKLFERSFNEASRSYSFEKSSYFKVDSGLFEKTRENSTFLSYAVANNADDLKPVYRYLSSISFINGMNVMPPITEFGLLNNAPYAEQIKEFIRNVDLGINDVVIKKAPLPQEQVSRIYGENSSIYNENNPNHPFNIEVSFTHSGSDDKSYSISLQDESDGTKKIFNYIGPFIDIINKGGILFIDEIDTSLHPLIVKELLSLFYSSSNNKGAQIIFTSHNPILLDADLLRRDQVWFSAKNDFGETDLYPLRDYKPRKNESIIRGYLGGRYGAIPFIENIERSMGKHA